MFAWLIILLGVLPVFADAPDPVQPIRQGDIAYAQRADLAKAREALQAYERAAGDGAGAEAFWKASRAAWWLGDQSASRPDKLRYFQKGVDDARQGLAQDPNSVECHFWLGGNLGSFGETKGVLKSLSLIKPIRHEMAEVNRINDHYDGGGGYRVLGVVDYQVPGIAGGSKKRALEQLNKSLAIDPQNLFTRYYLAEYFKTVGEKEKMRQEWDVFKSLKAPEEFKPEYDSLRIKGEKLFGK